MNASKAAQILGSIGGKAGTGNSKRRTHKQYSDAAKRRWGKWEHRYWSRIDIRGPDECWIWRPEISSLKSRYGTIYFNRKNIRPHRLGYMIAYGKIPSGMKVCHSCDNPRCNNPKHLFAGTQADNVADAIRKGRRRYLAGEASTNVKLSAKAVRTIRTQAANGVPRKKLAARFGVCSSAIHAIVHRINWKHI